MDNTHCGRPKLPAGSFRGVAKGFIDAHAFLGFLALLLLCFCKTRGFPGSKMVAVRVQQHPCCGLSSL